MIHSPDHPHFYLNPKHIKHIKMLYTSLVLAAAGVAVSAAPLEQLQARTATLNLNYHSNITSAKSLIEKGQERLKHINNEKTAGNSLASSGSITNEDVTYVAPVSIGGYSYSLIVDTGCKYWH